MEGCPKSLMISFDTKEPGSADFTAPLRNSVPTVARDNQGCSTLRRYFAQLQFLQSRFPMCEGGAATVPFTWYDVYVGDPLTQNDIRYEQACVLFNLGGLYSQLGANESRSTDESMKVACTYFQCSAGTFQYLKEHFNLEAFSDMVADILQLKAVIMLGQAQECLLEKSIRDSRKNTLIARICMQIKDYYQEAVSLLQGSNTAEMGSSLRKSWTKHLQIKMLTCFAIAYIYMSNEADQEKKFGEKVSYLKAASSKMNEAIKMSKNQPEQVMESLKFLCDVVGNKLEAAVKENDFVYHAAVPEIEKLPEIKGVCLVKAMQFQYDDPTISGPDIFQRLIPMRAHEASSLYSEEKARVLREVCKEIETKDLHLSDALISMQIDDLINPLDEGLPENLLEKRKKLNDQGDVIAVTIDQIKELALLSEEFDVMLNEISNKIDEEDRFEKEAMVVDRDSDSSQELENLKKEFDECKDVNEKARATNASLCEHFEESKEIVQLVTGPEEKIVMSLPSQNVVEAPTDEPVVQRIRELLAAVDKMKSQRKHLEAQFREQLNKDDITNLLVVKEDGKREEFFKEQLKKHDDLKAVIQQNLTAQDGILQSLTEANAKYAPTRLAAANIASQRESHIQCYLAHVTLFEEIKERLGRGLTFYKSLKDNLAKLLKKVNDLSQKREKEKAKFAELKKQVPPSRPTAAKPTFDRAAKPSAMHPGAQRPEDFNFIPNASTMAAMNQSGMQTTMQRPPIPVDARMMQQPMQQLDGMNLPRSNDGLNLPQMPQQMRPMRPEGPSVQPIRPGGPQMQPIRPEGPPMQPMRPGGPQMQQVRPEGPPMQPIRPEGPAMQPMRPGGPHLQPMRPEGPIMQPIRPESPQMQPMRPGGPHMQPMRPEGSPMQPMRPEGPIMQPIRPESPQMQPMRPEGPPMQPMRSEGPPMQPMRPEGPPMHARMPTSYVPGGVQPRFVPPSSMQPRFAQADQADSRIQPASTLQGPIQPRYQPPVIRPVGTGQNILGPNQPGGSQFSQSNSSTYQRPQMPQQAQRLPTDTIYHADVQTQGLRAQAAFPIQRFPSGDSLNSQQINRSALPGQRFEQSNRPVLQQQVIPPRFQRPSENFQQNQMPPRQIQPNNQVPQSSLQFHSQINRFPSVDEQPIPFMSSATVTGVSIPSVNPASNQARRSSYPISQTDPPKPAYQDQELEPQFGPMQNQGQLPSQSMMQPQSGGNYSPRVTQNMQPRPNVLRPQLDGFRGMQQPAPGAMYIRQDPNQPQHDTHQHSFVSTGNQPMPSNEPFQPRQFAGEEPYRRRPMLPEPLQPTPRLPEPLVPSKFGHNLQDARQQPPNLQQIPTQVQPEFSGKQSEAELSLPRNPMSIGKTVVGSTGCQSGPSSQFNYNEQSMPTQQPSQSSHPTQLSRNFTEPGPVGGSQNSESQSYKSDAMQSALLVVQQDIPSCDAMQNNQYAFQGPISTSRPSGMDHSHHSIISFIEAQSPSAPPQPVSIQSPGIRHNYPPPFSPTAGVFDPVTINNRPVMAASHSNDNILSGILGSSSSVQDRKTDTVQLGMQQFQIQQLLLQQQQLISMIQNQQNQQKQAESVQIEKLQYQIVDQQRYIMQLANEQQKLQHKQETAAEEHNHLLLAQFEQKILDHNSQLLQQQRELQQLQLKTTNTPIALSSSHPIHMIAMHSAGAPASAISSEAITSYPSMMPAENLPASESNSNEHSHLQAKTDESREPHVDKLSATHHVVSSEVCESSELKAQNAQTSFIAQLSRETSPAHQDVKENVSMKDKEQLKVDLDQFELEMDAVLSGTLKNTLKTPTSDDSTKTHGEAIYNQQSLFDDAVKKPTEVAERKEGDVEYAHNVSVLKREDTTPFYEPMLDKEQSERAKQVVSSRTDGILPGNEESNQHETSQGEAKQHEASQHEASQHEASQSEASQHEASQHEASQSEASQHEASQHESSQSEASQHEASGSSVTKVAESPGELPLTDSNDDPKYIKDLMDDLNSVSNVIATSTTGASEGNLNQNVKDVKDESLVSTPVMVSVSDVNDLLNLDPLKLPDYPAIVPAEDDVCKSEGEMIKFPDISLTTDDENGVAGLACASATVVSSESPNTLHPDSSLSTRPHLSRQQGRLSFLQSETDDVIKKAYLEDLDVNVDKLHEQCMELCKKQPGMHIDGFTQMWNDLAQIEELDACSFTTNAGKRNVNKNRYRDILPYDHTRVLLQNLPDDYINANHINKLTPFSPKYIASQGPIPQCFTDFWTMVWEQGCNIIVMLTNEVEGSKLKCHPYWPRRLEQTAEYGHMAVYFMEQEAGPYWKSRKFLVTNLMVNDSRLVIQLQFTAWPDYGIPNTPYDLLSFIEQVRQSFESLDPSAISPLLLHCSAGVGRTGTFACIYSAIEEINGGNGLVEVPGLIRRLRQCRFHMVQRKEQLIFSYQAILCYAQQYLGEEQMKEDAKTRATSVSLLEDEVMVQLNAIERQASSEEIQHHVENVPSEIAKEDSKVDTGEVDPQISQSIRTEPDDKNIIIPDPEYPSESERATQNSDKSLLVINTSAASVANDDQTSPSEESRNRTDSIPKFKVKSDIFSSKSPPPSPGFTNTFTDNNSDQI
eukprot:gene17461-19208_t